MKTRKLSIRMKLMLSISAMSIVCCALLGGIIYSKVSTMLVDQKKSDAMAMAQIAAGELDGDRFDAIETEQDAYFQETYDLLSKYKDGGTIEYIYTMKLDGDCPVFVVDTDEEEPADLFEEYEMLSDMEPAFAGDVCSDKEITSDEWGSYFSSYAPIFNSAGEVSGIVGCDITIESIDKDMSVLRFMIIAIVAGCCLLCVLIAFFISGSIGNNLTRLYKKVSELNSGNGDLTKQVQISSGDELEKIAQEFNTFIDKIRGLVSEVAGSSESVHGSSHNVNMLAKESNAQLSQITEALETISAHMQETSANTEMITEHLTETATQVSALCEKAAATSSEALEISNEAAGVKERTSEVEEKSRKIVDKLQEELKVATEKCKEIEQIDVITKQILKVASTTNILALNAHIEASKAGNFGKGFNIIADDVSKLSGQISDLVKDIQVTNAGVKSSVAALLEITNDVSDFLHDTVSSDYEQFVHIGSEYSENMNNVAKVLQTFYDETQVMNENISLIEQKIADINTVMGETADHITSVHCLGMELRDEANELLKIAEDNSSESQKMSSQVNQYVF